VVDLIEAFRDRGGVDLTDAVCPVEGASEPGNISIITAGSLGSDYWQRLSAIAWQRLVVGTRPGDKPDPTWDGRGREFFLVLRDRIAEETRADFLLVDARTGITDLGVLAASQLADDLVCMFVHNAESIDGTRTVIRAVAAAERIAPIGQEPHPVRVFPVLVRVPATGSAVKERELMDSADRRLDVRDLPSVERLMVVHSQPALQLSERVLMTQTESDLADSQLFVDYVRLFNLVLPGALIEEDVRRRTEAAHKMAFEDPESAGKFLTAVAERFPHEISYRALLQYFRLRGAFDEATLMWSQRFVEMTDRFDDPLVWDLVRACVEHLDLEAEVDPELLPLIETVWKLHTPVDWRVGVEVASAYGFSGNHEGLSRVMIRTAAEVRADDADGVAEILRTLIKHDLEFLGLGVIARCREAVRSAEVQRLSAKIIVTLDAAEEAERLLSVDGVESALREDPPLRVKLLRLAGRSDELAARARSDLADVVAELRSGGMSRRAESQLRQLAQLFSALERGDELRRTLQAIPLRPADAARLRAIEKDLLGGGF
jgi:hypothetical protein